MNNYFTDNNVKLALSNILNLQENMIGGSPDAQPISIADDEEIIGV